MAQATTGGIRVPLSLVQEQMWNLQRWAPEPGFYNEALRHRFPFAADPAAVAGALDLLVQRHESLRTSFPTFGGVPYQSIAPAVDVPLEVTDLRHLPPAQREAEMRAVQAADVEAPFDTFGGPAFRARLFLLDDATSELCLVLDHLVADATAEAILGSELDDVLAAWAAGEDPALARQELDYADFAVWQRRWMTAERVGEHERYWVDALRGMAPVRPVPYLGGANDPMALASSELTAPPMQYDFVLPDGVVGALRRRTRTSPFVIGAAAVAAVVARATGDGDTVLLTSASGRDRSELDPVVGLFGGTAVLRVDLSGDPAFEVVLRRARRAMLGILEHQQVPMARVFDAVRASGTVLSPLAIPVAVHFFHAAHHRWVPGTSVVARPPEREGPAVPELPEASKPLEFRFYDDGTTLWGKLLHHPDKYDGRLAASVVADLKAVLAAAAGDPMLRLSQLPVPAAAVPA
ncbi:MAG TPA: condensation domain-containing protein [Acidimicrobiales bacterium]|nr:condensation domain-containing protein [Acidimicrobiales bacterium]